MSAILPDAVHVRITPDGICFIDEDFFAPSPGASLNEAVLAHLQLEAAAIEMPIHAVIQDEQAHYTTSIQINIDGTSQPLGVETQASVNPSLPQTTTNAPLPSKSSPSASNPVPTSRPYSPLPEPYRGRLASICATASQDRFAQAARDADQLLDELSSQYGPSHLYTLAAGLVRGDIAWLARDFRYGLQAWIFMARSWHLHLGPQHGTTVLAVGNAVGCWRRLQGSDAKASAPHVVKLLQDVSIPNSDSAVQAINRQTEGTALAN